MAARPRRNLLICFDPGTLLKPKWTFGERLAQAAAKYGLGDIDATSLNEAYYNTINRYKSERGSNASHAAWRHDFVSEVFRPFLRPDQILPKGLSRHLNSQSSSAEGLTLMDPELPQLLRNLNSPANADSLLAGQLRTAIFSQRDHNLDALVLQGLTVHPLPFSSEQLRPNQPTHDIDFVSHHGHQLFAYLEALTSFTSRMGGEWVRLMTSQRGSLLPVVIQAKWHFAVTERGFQGRGTTIGDFRQFPDASWTLDALYDTAPQKLLLRDVGTLLRWLRDETVKQRSDEAPTNRNESMSVEHVALPVVEELPSGSVQTTSEEHSTPLCAADTPGQTQTRLDEGLTSHLDETVSDNQPRWTPRQLFSKYPDLVTLARDELVSAEDGLVDADVPLATLSESSHLLLGRPPTDSSRTVVDKFDSTFWTERPPRQFLLRKILRDGHRPVKRRVSPAAPNLPVLKYTTSDTPYDMVMKIIAENKPPHKLTDGLLALPSGPSAAPATSDDLLVFRKVTGDSPTHVVQRNMQKSEEQQPNQPVRTPPVSPPTPETALTTPFVVRKVSVESPKYIVKRLLAKTEAHGPPPLVDRPVRVRPLPQNLASRPGPMALKKEVDDLATRDSAQVASENQQQSDNTVNAPSAMPAGPLSVAPTTPSISPLTDPRTLLSTVSRTMPEKPTIAIPSPPPDPCPRTPKYSFVRREAQTADMEPTDYDEPEYLMPTIPQPATATFQPVLFRKVAGELPKKVVRRVLAPPAPAPAVKKPHSIVEAATNTPQAARTSRLSQPIVFKKIMLDSPRHVVKTSRERLSPELPQSAADTTHASQCLVADPSTKPSKQPVIRQSHWAAAVKHLVSLFGAPFGVKPSTGSLEPSGDRVAAEEPHNLDDKPGEVNLSQPLANDDVDASTQTAKSNVSATVTEEKPKEYLDRIEEALQVSEKGSGNPRLSSQPKNDEPALAETVITSTESTDPERMVDLVPPVVCKTTFEVATKPRARCLPVPGCEVTPTSLNDVVSELVDDSQGPASTVPFAKDLQQDCDEAALTEGPTPTPTLALKLPQENVSLSIEIRSTTGETATSSEDGRVDEESGTVFAEDARAWSLFSVFERATRLPPPLSSSAADTRADNQGG